MGVKINSMTLKVFDSTIFSRLSSSHSFDMIYLPLLLWSEEGEHDNIGTWKFSSFVILTFVGHLC